jgi:hypothetical protein
MNYSARTDARAISLFLAGFVPSGSYQTSMVSYVEVRMGGDYT